MQPRLAWDWLCRPGQPLTHRDLVVSASQVLGIKLWATIPDPQNKYFQDLRKPFFVFLSSFFFLFLWDRVSGRPGFRLTWNSLGHWDKPWTPDSPTISSQVLRLKASHPDNRWEFLTQQTEVSCYKMLSGLFQGSDKWLQFYPNSTPHLFIWKTHGWVLFTQLFAPETLKEPILFFFPFYFFLKISAAKS